MAAALVVGSTAFSADVPLAQAPGALIPDDSFAAAPDFFPSPGPEQSAAPPPAHPTQGSSLTRSGVELRAGEASPSPAPDQGSSGADSGGSGTASGGPGGGSSGSNGATGTMNTLSAQVFDLVNQERSAAGCAPVHSDDRLTAAAQLHSEDMDRNDYMSHTGRNGSTPGDRANAQGYQAWSGENVAKGQRSAQQVMDAWMNSPGHRQNILDCANKALGVGESGGAWTQLFGRV